MGKKTSVYLSDQTLNIMEKSRDKRNPDSAVAWSNIVNRSITICDFLFREHLPDFSASEWQAILNAYAGTIGNIEHPKYRVASDLMDDRGLVDVNDHPESELVKRIHSMSQVEQFAILMFNEIFWCGDWNDCADFDEIKARISTSKARDARKEETPGA